MSARVEKEILKSVEGDAECGYYAEHDQLQLAGVQ